MKPEKRSIPPKLWCSRTTEKEVKSGGNEKQIESSDNAMYLLDNTTVIFLTEVVKPHVLFSFKYLNLAGGPTGNVFEGRTFLDAVPMPRTNVAIAVERDRSMSGPPRLQRLELLAQDDHELATLDSYNGGLSLCPPAPKSRITSTGKRWRFATSAI